jgi:hypothetical protein
MTKTRNRSRPKATFDERLTKAAMDARSKAEHLEPSLEREELLAKALQFEMQVRMNKMLQADERDR